MRKPSEGDPSSPWTDQALRHTRRVVVFVVGMSIVLFGVALIVLPGPAFVVIPAGLAILALEFRWAKRLLRRASYAVRSRTPAGRARKARRTARARRRSEAPAPLPGSADAPDRPPPTPGPASERERAQAAR